MLTISAANSKKRLSVALFLALTLSLPALAGTFYVDAVNGSDTNNGTSTSTPWKSLTKVSGLVFKAGDTVLLKRGCEWRGQIKIWGSGTAAGALTYGAYGTGANPVINGAVAVSSWTLASTNKYTASVGVQPEVVVFNGVKGIRETSVANLNAANEWYWESGVLTVYSTSAPVNMEVQSQQFVVGFYSVSYVTVKDLTLKYGSYPVLVYNGSHNTVDSLTVYDSAGSAGIYLLSEAPGVTAYNTVTNCTVYNITGSTDAIASGNNGCGIYIYGELATNNTITGCTVHDVGHEGLVILSGSYNTIANSTVYRCGQSGIRVALETCTGNVIEGNTSYGNGLASDDRFGIDLIRVGNNNIVRYNTVHDQHETKNDPNVPADPLNGGQKYGTGGIRFDGGNWEGHTYMESTGNAAYYNVVYGEDIGLESFNFSNIGFYNNTVYNSTQYGISIQSVFDVVCSNNVVKNNVVQTAGTALVYHYRMNNTSFDNNVYYPDASGAFLWRTTTAYSKTNFAGWKTNTAQESHSRAANPAFKNAASADFALQSGSACVDAGVALGLSRDLVKSAVPQGGAPDAGAMELAQTVVASDTTKPVIALLGNASVTVEAGASYTDAGATASDDVDGDISSRIVKGGSVNTSVPGNYTLTFNVSDSAGNAADQVVRTVRVSDTTKPVITMLGSSPVTVQAGSGYSDAGATAQDSLDGVITSRINATNNVNTAALGSYTVVYTVSDSAGNAAAAVTRVVNVVDTVPPAIALLGSASVSLQVGASYSDAGATAYDAYDGDVTARIVKSGSVNTSAAGTYTLAYNVSDASGNAAATVTRTVTVTSGADTTRPVITLIGSSTVKVRWGSTYTDAGATAIDNVDGDITSRLVLTGTVNTRALGTYVIVYSVADSAGNTAVPVTRTVKVTFFGKTDASDGEPFVVSPADGSTLYVASGVSTVPVTFSASVPSGVTSVEFAIDGIVVGAASEAPFALVADLDVAALGWGDHQVSFKGSAPGTEETANAQSLFTLAPVAAEDDANGNALPDNPFATLPLDGDAWMDAVAVAETGGTRFAGVTRFDGSDNPVEVPVAVVLDHPGDASRGVSVSVQRAVLDANEIGIVMVTMADDLQTLFGASAASQLLPEPDGKLMAQGGMYVEISILVSADQGATFQEIDESRLADYPVHVELRGVDTAAGVDIQKHEMYVDSDETTGVAITAQAGAWSASGVVNAQSAGSVVSMDLTSLSVLAPYSGAKVALPGAGCAGGSLGSAFNAGYGDMVLLLAAVAALIIISRKRVANASR